LPCHAASLSTAVGVAAHLENMEESENLKVVREEWKSMGKCVPDRGELVQPNQKQ